MNDIDFNLKLLELLVSKAGALHMRLTVLFHLVALQIFLFNIIQETT